MAEERKDDRQEERSEETQQSAAPEVKKKKAGKGRLIFILLLLAAGLGAGLHFSGRWDARPLMWGIVPRIPYVGQPLAEFFEIPRQYTLTSAARRAYELEEWQKRLDDRERALATRELAAEAASSDRTARARQDAPAQPPAPDVSPKEKEKEQVAQVRKQISEMSARNAAQLVEQMGEALAVELLKGLSTENSASILAKMDPKKAARLMEIMAMSQ